jgi:thymidylate kinase
MLITFSGLDGAGKSTLIAWLQSELERRARPVAVFHMNDHVGVYAYLRAIRDRVRPHRAPPRPAGPAATTPLKRGLVAVRNAVIWNKSLRRLLYPIDLAVFCVYRLLVEKLRGRVLIMDRYFYDSLVDVSNGRGTRWLRFLARLTPTPDLAVFLDISPEESYARKGEYSVEYLRARWRHYRAVAPWVRTALVLDNRDLAHTQRILARALEERRAW